MTPRKRLSNSTDGEPEPNPKPTFTELEPNMNLIFLKYSEPEQNRTLIIKNPEANTKPKFRVLSHLEY